MKLKEWKVWDLKSVYFMMIFVIFVSLFFFLKANASHFALAYIQRNMSGSVAGKLTERSPIREYSQSAKVSKPTIQGLLIGYTYTVNGTIYHEQQRLTYSFMDAEKLGRLSAVSLPFKILVKYNPEQPYLSSVSLDN